MNNKLTCRGVIFTDKATLTNVSLNNNSTEAVGGAMYLVLL